MNKKELLDFIDKSVTDDDMIRTMMVRQVIETPTDGDIIRKDPGDLSICIIIGPDTERNTKVMNLFERLAGNGRVQATDETKQP